MKLLKLSGFPHYRAIQTIARFAGLPVPIIVRGIVLTRFGIIDNRLKQEYIDARGW